MTAPVDGAPDVDDPVTAPFWAAAAQGRVVVQRCRGCGALRWPPLVGCPECLSRDTEWVPVAGTGTVWSFVVYHRAFQPALRDAVPYTVAVVQLDEGPYVVGRLLAGEPRPVVGERAIAAFEPVGPPGRAVTHVRWRLTRSPAPDQHGS